MHPAEKCGPAGKTFQATALAVCSGTQPRSRRAHGGRFSSGVLLLCAHGGESRVSPWGILEQRDKSCEVIAVLRSPWRGIEEFLQGLDWGTLAKESSRLPGEQCQSGGWHWTATDHVPTVRGERSGHTRRLLVQLDWPPALGVPWERPCSPRGCG